MGTLAATMIDLLGYDPDGVEPSRPSRPSRPELHLVIVPPETIVPARDRGRDVAVARLASGKLVVVDDACPHDGGLISDGYVEGEHLVCARHGWALSAEGGSCRRACKLRE